MALSFEIIRNGEEIHVQYVKTQRVISIIKPYEYFCTYEPQGNDCFS